MVSWIEIDRIRKDPKVFKPLAGHLLADAEYARERSEFATDFLENISRSEKEELTTRQGEILLELRNDVGGHVVGPRDQAELVVLRECARGEREAKEARGKLE